MFADEDLHHHAVENLDQADALLFGRVTYEMMEAAFRPPPITVHGPLVLLQSCSCRLPFHCRPVSRRRRCGPVADRLQDMRFQLGARSAWSAKWSPRLGSDTRRDPLTQMQRASTSTPRSWMILGARIRPKRAGTFNRERWIPW